MSDADFKLSRVYAEGWRAANALPASACDGLDIETMARINPYATEPARSRWNEGFAKASGHAQPA
jgi:hypothetical protein